MNARTLAAALFISGLAWGLIVMLVIEPELIITKAAQLIWLGVIFAAGVTVTVIALRMP